MSLRTAVETEDWKNYLFEAGISVDSAKNYAATFESENLTKEILQMIDQAMLRELGVKAMGEAISIIKQAKEFTTLTITAEAAAARLSRLHLEMTPQQFRKF